MADIILKNPVNVTNNRTNHQVLLDRMQWEEPQQHLTYTEIWISYDFYVSKNIPFLFYLPITLKWLLNVKPILSSQVIQKQVDVANRS